MLENEYESKYELVSNITGGRNGAGTRAQTRDEGSRARNTRASGRIPGRKAVGSRRAVGTVASIVYTCTHLPFCFVTLRPSPSFSSILGNS